MNASVDKNVRGTPSLNAVDRHSEGVPMHFLATFHMLSPLLTDIFQNA